MRKKISSDVIHKWLTGWALSRELTLPVKYKSGFRVDVGYDQQKTRYVFSELNDDFIQLSKSIDDPWVFLKVFASPIELKNLIAAKWIIQPQGYLMTNHHPMQIQEINLSDDYTLEFDQYNCTFVVRIVTKTGEIASTGRIVTVDEVAVYDRVQTEENHRRKGLATFVMKELEKIAVSKTITRNFMVATEEGKKLYLSLGWEVDSLYTSVVIPG